MMMLPMTEIMEVVRKIEERGGVFAIHPLVRSSRLFRSDILDF